MGRFQLFDLVGCVKGWGLLFLGGVHHNRFPNPNHNLAQILIGRKTLVRHISKEWVKGGGHIGQCEERYTKQATISHGKSLRRRRFHTSVTTNVLPLTPTYVPLEGAETHLLANQIHLLFFPILLSTDSELPDPLGIPGRVAEQVVG